MMISDADKDTLCEKIAEVRELTETEKKYLESLIRADRVVVLSCPKCGCEMLHPPTRKMELLRDYRDAVRTVEQAKKAHREWQENIRRSGTYRAEIMREPDEHKRLRLCIRAIAAMTQDQVFEKMELERLKG